MDESGVVHLCASPRVNLAKAANNDGARLGPRDQLRERYGHTGGGKCNGTGGACWQAKPALTRPALQMPTAQHARLATRAKPRSDELAAPLCPLTHAGGDPQPAEPKPARVDRWGPRISPTLGTH